MDREVNTVHCTTADNPALGVNRFLCNWDAAHPATTNTPGNYEDLKSIIAADEGRWLFLTSKTGVEQIYMTKGFCTGLKDIVTDLAKRSTKIYLYYGIPSIGKSTLARALEFYLGLMHRKTVFIECCHHANLDYQSVPNAVRRAFEGENLLPFECEVLICDQVNTSNIECLRFLHDLGRRPENNLPIIIFTSGHYFPNADWQEEPEVTIRVIHLECTQAEAQEVGSRKVSRRVNFIPETWQQWKILGLVLKFAGKSLPTLLLDKDTNDFLFVIMADFCVKGGSITLDQAREQGMFDISLAKFQLCQEFVKTRKEVDENGLNAILSSLVPRLHSNDHSSKGYKCVKTIEKLSFHITLERHVFETITHMECPLQILYECAVSLFSAPAVRGALSGLCYKLLIDIYCRIKEVAFESIMKDSVLRELDAVKLFEASNADDVTKQLIKFAATNPGDNHAVLWFSLNRYGHEPYPGYDFISIQARTKLATGDVSFRILKMDLIQATVSWESKTPQNKKVMFREYYSLLEALQSNDSVKIDGPTASVVKVIIVLPDPGYAGRVPLDKEKLIHEATKEHQELRAGIRYSRDFPKTLK